MIHRNDLRIRDPFVLTDPEAGCYYLYGTIDLLQEGYATAPTFSVCRSDDLEHLEEPRIIFDARRCDFPAMREFWAPEVHKYNGKYYLFGTCKAEDRCRGTYVFVCDTPDGEFRPLSEQPVTPPDWECLDGTLFVEDGIPYMVFCHEWLQVGDGEICAVPLSEDLSHPTGAPFLLFRASDNPHVSEFREGRGEYVTDGPFLYRENGKIQMIWSGFCHGRYLVLGAQSDSLRGTWTHSGSMFPFDGGHAMLFTTLQGQRMIALHTPNTSGLERFVFYPA